MAEITPMMRQYYEIKEKHSDCILFFRLGDFYEMFDDDARVASKELDLTLTSRDHSKEASEDKIPMCGVPYHSSEAYISRLIAKGYKVAICEQMEDPALAKGLVERDVIRIVTPGTVIESSMLEDGKSNYICSVYADSDGCAVCFADISTGEVCATSFPAGQFEKLTNELSRFAPAEAIVNSAAGENPLLLGFLRNKLGCLVQSNDSLFDFMTAAMRVCDQFNTNDLDKLGIGDVPSAVCAIGGLLSHLINTQKTDLSYLSSLDYYGEGRYMEIDFQTVKNLELLSTIRTNDKKGSLLWVLDKARTPMGSRMIRAWLSKPLLSASMIKRRQSAVQELVSATMMRGELDNALRGIGDIERLIGKIVYGTAGGRDMAALSSSISVLPRICTILEGCQSQLISECARMDLLSDICRLIQTAITDDPPFSIREGGFIRDGYNEEVDYLRGLLNNSAGAMAAIEAREKERTGKKLRVGYNKVFGYYIEIPRSLSADVPEDYIRKQTLTNCERFITQELKELETTLLNAKDRIADLEYRLFTEIRGQIAARVNAVQETASAVATLDALCSLACVAVSNNYCMPEIDVSGCLEIRDGRHPVVETVQTDTLFVPNDVNLNSETRRAAIITGPNMAGKSTYMRQTALIVLMAQMGSFVPASSAHIGIVDRVFTRIGASDDLSAGKSTFMVEMTEVAEIIRHATNRSLLILDEIGRGTSTYDGMAIARAVLEFCADPKKLGAKTLFATHYHELTEMETPDSGIINLNISAKKRGNDLIFLRKIVPGGADDSYGIEVAGLAGVPDPVIRRAKAILSALDEGREVASPRRASTQSSSSQLSMDDLGSSQISETLRNTDLNTISPIEAMNLLFELKKLL